MVGEMLATIVNIQPKDSGGGGGGGGGETRESVVYQLADDMLSKLPADYTQHEVTRVLLRLLCCIVQRLKTRNNCPRWRIEVRLTALQRPYALDSVFFRRCRWFWPRNAAYLVVLARS